jgi:hypothetical protein
MSNYFLPNMIYAARAIHEGGGGLFWNAYGNAGAPFFAEGSVGLLYPTTAFFVFLDPLDAMTWTLAFNTVVAGVGMYALARTLGANRFGSTAAALAFQLGNAMLHATTWQPLVGSPVAWLPAALAAAEHLLNGPSLRRAVLLGSVLAMLWLPGYPMVTLFAYQMIGLRFLWRWATEHESLPWGASVGFLILAGVFSLSLPAVQVLPSVDTALRSVRGAGLSAQDIGGGLSLFALGRRMAMRAEVSNPLLFFPCLLAVAGFAGSGVRRHACGYAVIALVYLILAFGESGILYSLYRALPLGTVFRGPQRFVWATEVCLALLVGLGVHTLSHAKERWSPLGKACVIAGMAAVAAGFRAASGGKLVRVEWPLAATAIIAVLLAPAARRAVGAWLVVGLAFWLAALLGSPASVGVRLRAGPYLKVPTDVHALDTNAASLQRLRELMSPQDRAYLIITEHGRLALNPKTPMLARVRGIQDYTTQPFKRYSDLYAMMRLGTLPGSLMQAYGGGWSPWSVRFRTSLLDLLGGRFLVVETKRLLLVQALRQRYREVFNLDGLIVFENTNALPRASFVPRVEVVPDPAQVLRRLAETDHDARSVALIEEPPANGFLGSAVPARTEAPVPSATVEFDIDEPERIRLTVRAAERGFVRLADQHAPGWRAWVDRVPTPILLADYAFRLVEVPAGRSTVDLVYRPPWFCLGAWCSGLTALVMAAALLPGQSALPSWRWARRRV